MRPKICCIKNKNTERHNLSIKRVFSLFRPSKKNKRENCRNLEQFEFLHIISSTTLPAKFLKNLAKTNKQTKFKKRKEKRHP